MPNYVRDPHSGDSATGAVQSFENVITALAELPKNGDFRWFREHSPGGQFGELRRGVEGAMDRCRVRPPDAPTIGEMRVRLNGLRALCVGTLSRFSAFIEEAQAVLR